MELGEAHRSPLCSGSHPTAPGTLQDPQPLATTLGHPAWGSRCPQSPSSPGRTHPWSHKHHGPKAPQKNPFQAPFPQEAPACWPQAGPRCQLPLPPVLPRAMGMLRGGPGGPRTPALEQSRAGTRRHRSPCLGRASAPAQSPLCAAVPPPPPALTSMPSAPGTPGGPGGPRGPGSPGGPR